MQLVCVDDKTEARQCLREFYPNRLCLICMNCA